MEKKRGNNWTITCYERLNLSPSTDNVFLLGPTSVIMKTDDDGSPHRKHRPF